MAVSSSSLVEDSFTATGKEPSEWEVFGINAAFMVVGLGLSVVSAVKEAEALKKAPLVWAKMEMIVTGLKLAMPVVSSSESIVDGFADLGISKAKYKQANAQEQLTNLKQQLSFNSTEIEDNSKNADRQIRKIGEMVQVIDALANTIEKEGLELQRGR
jgi:peptidoglycan hydrolase CwlO-like protein